MQAKLTKLASRSQEIDGVDSSSVKHRILVVDSAPRIRSYLKDILKDIAIVDEASDINNAIDGYKKIKHQLIFLNIFTPSDIEKIKSFDPNAKIIVLSYSIERNLIKRCLELGAIDFIAKPFDPERVLWAVEQAALDPAAEKEEQVEVLATEEVNYDTYDAGQFALEVAISEIVSQVYLTHQKVIWADFNRGSPFPPKAVNW
ncbi:response regulator [Candidatus Auribacterota bacterium]